MSKDDDDFDIYGDTATHSSYETTSGVCSNEIWCVVVFLTVVGREGTSEGHKMMSPSPCMTTTWV